MPANQTVKINFEVNTQPLSKAEQDYKNFNDSLNKGAEKSSESLKKVENNTSNLGSQFKQIAPMIAGAFAVDRILAFGKAVIDVSSEFQRLESVLKTTLGSKSEAQSALKQIQNFASQTPFQVQELTNSYVKLANQGFKPTIEQMRSLGDLASSTGKSFDQLTEAVIDAQVGEFERLKEFGIRASKQGDIVKFTFKGVETQTKFTSEAIQQYVLGLGKLDGVTGSMVGISNTLGGSISNLSDKWDMFLNTVGSKTDGIFKGAIEVISNTISLIGDAIKSEEQLMKESIADSYSAIEKQQKNIFESVIKAGIERGEDELKIIKEYSQKKESQLLADNEFLQKRINTVNQDLKNTALSIEEKKDIEFRKKQFIFQLEENKQIIEINKKLTEEYSKESAKKVDIIQKEKDAILKYKQSQFQQELQLLAIKEQNAKVEAELYENNAVEKLAIEQDFNDKRIAIYEKYNNILTKTDLETKDGLNQNSAVIIDKIDKLADEESKAKIDALRKQWEAERVEQEKIDIEKIKRLEESSKVKQDFILKEEAEALTEVEKMTFKSEEEKQKAIFDIQKDYTNLKLNEDIKLLDAKILANENNKDKILELEKEKADKILELEKNKNAKIDDESKKALDKRKQDNHAYFQVLLSTIQGFTNLAYEKAKQQTQLESEELQERKNQKLSNKKLTDSEKEVLEAQYRQKELAIKRKVAQQDKDKALFDVAINTAVAISSATKNPTTASFVIPLVTALGLAQAIAIQQRPLPKYFKGTEFVGLNGNAKGQDTIHAMLNEGERVVPTDINSKLKGIKNTDLPYLIELGTMKRKELNSNSIAKTVVNIDNKDLVNAFKSRPEVSIDINEKGFRKHLISESKRQEIINSRYAV
jgi:hypothetical protein